MENSDILHLPSDPGNTMAFHGKVLILHSFVETAAATTYTGGNLAVSASFSKYDRGVTAFPKGGRQTGYIGQK